MKALLDIGKKGIESLGKTLTFDIKDIEIRPYDNGNVAYKATTHQGKKVSFWMSNMDLLVEPVEGKTDQFQVIPGTTLGAADSAGVQALFVGGTKKSIWE